MRLPTKKEVLDFIDVINSMSIKTRPTTVLGLNRVLAKHFHCKIKDIESILK